MAISKTNNMKEGNVVVEAMYAVSRTVASMLNIGDAGKVDSFIGKIEKDSLKAIRGCEKNIENIKYNLKNETDDLEEQLQDAEVELAESFNAIPLNKIQSNQDQNEFKTIYLRNIKSKKEAISKIKESIEEANDRAKETEYVDNYGNIGINGLEKLIKDTKEIVEEVTKKA